MALLILAIVTFVFLSGVLAAVDAAVLSVTGPEVHELILNGKWGSRQLRQVKDNLTRAVAVIVIVTNTINVLGPILVSRQAFDLFGVGAIGIVTATLTLATIVFSEVIPKAIGTHYAPLISRLAAPAIQVIGLCLYPLVIALAWFSNLFRTGTRRIGTEDQIRSLAAIGRRAGYIESDEGRLIHRAFVLNDRSAADIMTPLAEVIGLQMSDTIAGAADQVRECEYSRYPLFGASPDDVRGVVMIRDILEAVAEDRGEAPITAIVRTCPSVDAGLRSDDLLALFREQHTHLAVVQEAGRTLGVVTLEDVLEQLVGEIEDERDVEDRAP